MRDYGKVFSTFWTSDSTRGLSDDAKVLALYLLTGPHSNAIGCFRLPDGYVSEDLGWTLGRVSKGFGELFQKGFATREESTKWVFVTKYLKWNPLENPNQGKAAIKLFEQIPDASSVKPLMATALADFAYVALKGFETLLKPFRNPSETVSKPETETETGTETGTGAEDLLRSDGEAVTTQNATPPDLPPPVYELPLRTRSSQPPKFFGVTKELFEAWSEAYPLVDVRHELKEVKAWLVSNPKKRPASNMARFVNSWLDKSQNKLSTIQARQSRASPPMAMSFVEQENARVRAEIEAIERQEAQNAHHAYTA